MKQIRHFLSSIKTDAQKSGSFFCLTVYIYLFIHIKSYTNYKTDRHRPTVRTMTRSAAIVEGQRDASCQLKSCQLPRNSAETTCIRQVLNQVSAVAN